MQNAQAMRKRSNPAVHSTFNPTSVWTLFSFFEVQYAQASGKSTTPGAGSVLNSISMWRLRGSFQVQKLQRRGRDQIPEPISRSIRLQHGDYVASFDCQLRNIREASINDSWFGA